MGQFAEERKAIEGRFSSNWTTTSIKYENVPFTQPTTAWVALFIRNGAGGRNSIGTTTPRRRFFGSIIIQIFVLPLSGSATARGYADTIAAIYRDASFACGSTGTIVCQEPAIETLGERNGWFQVNVTVPYRRDDVF